MVKSKYDTVEDKYFYLPRRINPVNPLNNFKFNADPTWTGIHKHSKYEVPLRFRSTPETLVELCAIVVDKFKMPSAFCWTTHSVMAFITRLGFPQYTKTFFDNKINGRTLLLVDASALAAMNIKNFEHIKRITWGIRELFKVEYIRSNRSISLPPRYPPTHYKFYRVLTGPKYDSCRHSDLFRKMKLIREAPANENHWVSLEKWLKHSPDYQMERIGYAHRYDLYGQKRELQKKAIAKKEVTLCSCIPPCECGWTDRDYQRSRVMNCLLKHIPAEEEKLEIFPKILGMKRMTEQSGKPIDELCNCHLKCECPHRGIQVLTLLKDTYPAKYSTPVVIKG